MNAGTPGVRHSSIIRYSSLIIRVLNLGREPTLQYATGGKQARQIKRDFFLALQFQPVQRRFPGVALIERAENRCTFEAQVALQLRHGRRRNRWVASE